MLNPALSGNLSGKRILITGAGGFIGTHLSGRLCRMGAEVHGTSRMKKESDKDNFTWWQGTFDDVATATTLLQTIRPHFIFHLAGEATASNDMRFVLPTFHSILTSTVNILTAANEVSCERIILPASCTEPINLNQVSSSPYAAAKWAASGYARLFHTLYGTPVVNVRTFMGYVRGKVPGNLFHMLSMHY